MSSSPVAAPVVADPALPQATAHRATSLPAHWVDLAPKSDLPEPTAPWLRASAAVASTMFATHEGPPSDARLRWLCHHLLDFQVRVGGLGMLSYRAALFAFTWLAPLAVLSLPPFRRLSHARRMQAMHRFERTPIGIVVFALKALLCLIWFEHPEGVAELHFDGSPKTVPPSPMGQRTPAEQRADDAFHGRTPEAV